VNPRIGSGMQQGREVTEEQTVEVVQNHEGGTQDGNWRSHPEGGAEPPAAQRCGREGAKRLQVQRTPGLVRWRGDLWTTPREETRLCSWVARTGTRRESRRQGQEGRASLHANVGERTGRRVLEGRNTATCSKAEEGSSERPGSRNFDRSSSPRRWHLSMWRRGADHAPASRARHRQTRIAASAAGPPSRGVRRMRTERTVRP
jgi:hypothetical protein